MINRLLVIVQLILVPIYFIFFSLRWRDNIIVFFDFLQSNYPFLSRFLPPWLVWFEINLGIPIFFSFPWIVFSILKATRIADSYELMGRALGKVRIDQKLFYGLNAAFALIFLIFPFLSPIITIIGIFWAVRIILRKAFIGKLSKLIWFIPALLLSLVPGLITFAFYSNYEPLFNQILATWREAIPDLFGIGLTLAIAISLGNFMLFLFEGGVKYGDREFVPHDLVLVVKFVFFLLLLLIYFSTPPPHQFINFVNYFAVGLGFFELVMRRVRDLPNEDGTASGIIMVIAFSVVNIVILVIQQKSVLTTWIQTIVIVLSALIFFVLFYLSYSYAEEEFGYYGDDSHDKGKSRAKKNKFKDNDVENDNEENVND